MRKNWYSEAAHIIHKAPKTRKINDAYEVLNAVMRVLERHGFVDADWWAEIEPDDPRYS